ncbi:MAG: hypothetical protein VBE63_10015 [Lamprobacter sp.]|uniref:hypothetical protein n=1 Tax=Lamprobacter sp. TaxID=3100796 RepID=UPI002B25DEBC|nr:hypothetical protein [Lamprobacter sp.]MEA3640266.1 hypothetical protein [Lamprobacter sp.]
MNHDDQDYTDQHDETAAIDIDQHQRRGQKAEDNANGRFALQQGRQAFGESVCHGWWSIAAGSARLMMPPVGNDER